MSLPATAGDEAPAGEGGLFSRPYRASTIGFACVMLLEGFAALALVTIMPVAVGELHGLRVYTLALGGFVTTSLFGSVLGGELADRRGPRWPLLVGLALFLVGLVIAGTAGSVWQLVAGRCIQGFASSIVVVALNVTVGHVYPSRLRPAALSLMSTCWIVPSMVGPAIAGAVTELLGWRWVFIGLAILVVVSAAAPVRLLGRLAPVPVEAPRSPTGRVGAAGVVAVGAGLLQYAASGWDLVHLAFAAAGIAALVPSVTRLFPEGTLRAARGLPTMVLLRGISSGIYFTLESFVPLLLINQRHVSVTLAGISFTGATLSWAFAAWLQGHPWSAVPRHRLVFTGSAVIVGSALIATVSVIGTVPPLLASVALIVAGFGMGLVLPSLTVLTLDHSRPEDQGRYSAALQAAQGLGSVVVIGAAGALFNAGTRLGLPGNTVYGAVFAAVVVISIPACLLALRTRVVGHADTTAPAG